MVPSKQECSIDFDQLYVSCIVRLIYSTVRGLACFFLGDSYYPTFCYFTTVNHIFHWLNFVFVDYASILSLFTRCCLWRSVRVSYYRTEYFCCPGWKTSTYENCDVGKKIDRIEGNVRLWVVTVTSNNISARSWPYVLFGG